MSWNNYTGNLTQVSRKARPHFPWHGATTSWGTFRCPIQHELVLWVKWSFMFSPPLSNSKSAGTCKSPGSNFPSSHQRQHRDEGFYFSFHCQLVVTKFCGKGADGWAMRPREKSANNYNFPHQSVFLKNHSHSSRWASGLMHSFFNDENTRSVFINLA